MVELAQREHHGGRDKIGPRAGVFRVSQQGLLPPRGARYPGLAENVNLPKAETVPR